MPSIVFENQLFVLKNVMDVLPKHKNFPLGSNSIDTLTGQPVQKTEYIKIKDRKIQTVFFHQTAGSYQKGYEGLMNTSRFFIEDPVFENRRWTGNGRGWPGMAYTFYVPFCPDKCNGKLEIYQCWDLDWVTYHTGQGHNRTSVGIAFQGYFKSRHITNFVPFKGTTGSPSSEQMDIAESIWEDYFKPKLGLLNRDLSGHFRAGKPSCPGDVLEAFVIDKNCKSEDFKEVDKPIALDTWEKRQAALVLLGFKLGNTGTLKNGVDGKPGYKTRSSIEQLEKEFGMVPSGVWDQHLEDEVVHALEKNGVTSLLLSLYLPKENPPVAG